MRLQYFGHSCFRLISDIGTTIVCDPYSAEMVGFEMPRTRTDVVTVSHHHADHDCTDDIVGGYALLDGKVTCAADDIAVDTIETWHDEEKGAKRGANIVFTFLVDGIKVAHMGDIGCYDKKVVDFVRGCDLMLLPVGGVYTVDAVGAMRYVKEISPKIVVPMHFMTAEHKFTLDGVDKFLDLCRADGLTIADNGADEMRLDEPPQNEQTQVVVLQRYID